MRGGLSSRVRDVIEDLDLVRATDIGRRCGVSRTTVMRWRARGPEGAVSILPPPHLRMGGGEYWSWRLLSRDQPERFPPDPGRSRRAAGEGNGAARSGRGGRR